MKRAIYVGEPVEGMAHDRWLVALRARWAGARGS